MAAESEKWHTLQHLCTFRGRKKVVISSFPDFKGKVQVTAIYQSFDNPKNHMISETYHKDGNILSYCLFYLF